jgi:glutaminyl-tRNA synthetase
VQEVKAAKAAKAAKPAKEAAAAPAEADPDAMFREGFLSRLHAPGGNPQQKDALREQHLKATGGRVFTRFPPEPNGYLHVGHIKAIAVDFGYARYHGGQCYLRFDDTNPEAESEEYFEAILEMVRWLGFEPFKITYSSDYFDQLYALAVELIRRGKAYVDHSTPEEIKQGRGGEERGPRVASKWRDRPVEESLADFEAMRDGKFPPGKVTLRMKQDLLGSGNPQMWDLIAYRVLDAPHHRTGTRWKIYPTYDFTHCLVDSFENISHSLCTTEFILSRESYEWLCDALDVYKPRQYEFGRLALEGTVTSKRKILKLVTERHVNGWDDPRLFTMMALRRRGIPPGALLSFVNQLGVTTSPATTSIQRFEQAVRQYLEMQTPRLMMVVRPLRIVLENVPEDFVLQLERPLHPKNPAMGTARVPFARVNYIDASDFRPVDSPDYFRLAPGKTVGLLNAPFPVTCTSWVDAAGATSGEPVEVRVRYEDPAHGGNAQARSKTYVQWVGEHAPSGSPVVIDEVRTYERLFTVDNPAGEANFLDTINPNSLQVMQGAMIETGFWHVAALALREARKVAESRTKAAQEEAHRATAAEESAIAAGSVGATHTGDGAPTRKADQLVGNEVVRFQGMRIAYFALDKESSLECLREGAAADAAPRKGTSDRLVLNRIVTLKEDSGKSGAEAPKK